MFGLSFGSVKRDVIGVIDVGSGSAAVGILQLRGKDPALILAASRTPLSFEDRTEDQSISAVAAAIRQAGEKTFAFYNSQKEHPVPGRLFMFLRVPWSRSRSLEARQKLEQETLITDKMISALGKQVLDTEKDIDPKNLLEASVMKILLNGYQVSNLRGKRAHSIAVSVLLSDANVKLKAAALESAITLFPTLSPLWRSHTRAVMRVLGAGVDNWRNCVVVDIGTEGTSICVVRKGVLFEQVAITDGSRSILRAISPKGMPEETLALLSVLERDQAGESTEQIRASIAQSEPVLVRMFGESFSNLAASRRLPNKLLLIVHPDLSPMLVRFLSKIDFAQFTVTTQPFSVLSLDAKNLGRHVIPGNAVTPDPSLSVAAAFVNIEESDAS